MLQVQVPSQQCFGVVEMESVQEDTTQPEPCLFHLQLSCNATDTLCAQVVSVQFWGKAFLNPFWDLVLVARWSNSKLFGVMEGPK